MWYLASLSKVFASRLALFDAAVWAAPALLSAGWAGVSVFAGSTGGVVVSAFLAGCAGAGALGATPSGPGPRSVDGGAGCPFCFEASCCVEEVAVFDRSTIVGVILISAGTYLTSSRQEYHLSVDAAPPPPVVWTPKS